VGAILVESSEALWYESEQRPQRREDKIFGPIPEHIY
jgi:hypothetical protein